MHPLLTIATRAARKAGNFLTKNYEVLSTAEPNQQNSNDFIMSVTRDTRNFIADIIHSAYPDHTIISYENEPSTNVNAEAQWIINPLSGTTNFIKRFPHFALSIAARIKGRTEIAVIYDPLRNEIFTAARGQGAQLNNYRLRISKINGLKGAILAADPAFMSKNIALSNNNVLSNLLDQGSNFRWSGSSVLDFAYVAAGRLDGFFQAALKIENFASGELLVRESGGLVTDFSGDPNYYKLGNGNIIAGNPIMVKALLKASNVINN